MIFLNESEQLPSAVTSSVDATVDTDKSHSQKRNECQPDYKISTLLLIINLC